MAIDRRGTLADQLAIGQRAQRLGVQLCHRRRNRRRRIGPAQHKGRAQHRLVAPAKRAHGTQHGFVPDKRRIAIDIAGDDRVRIDEILSEQDGAHRNHVFGVLRAGGHAHEGLVGMFHRRIGDPQMPLADRMIVRLDNVMGRRMQRRQHVAELVKHRQIVQRRVAAHIVQVAQKGRPGHRDEHRVPPSQPQVAGRVAGRIGEVRRDRRDQVADQPPVGKDGLADHPGPGAAPVVQRDIVAEHHAHVFKNIHRGRVDAFYLRAGHDLAMGQGVFQAGQHRKIMGGTHSTTGGAPPGAAAGIQGHRLSPDVELMPV